MEIIQTYESEGAEICVLSNGNTISFADKNDIAVESPKVGSVVRPSQMSELYLEIPKDLLQEIARRSEIHVDPDEDEEEEEEASGEDGDEEDEEEADLPAWEPLAVEKFMVEFAALDSGVNMNILVNFPVKISWVDGEHAEWNTTDDSTNLVDVLNEREVLQSSMASVTVRIVNLNNAMAVFALEQSDLGHDVSSDDVCEHLNRTLSEREVAPVITDAARAAE